MEAATPLRQTNVRTIGDRLAVDGLVIADECAVRLVREREEAGEDAVRVVTDAVEIGARVLDREQAGANAEFVKNEFDKVSREVEHSFSDRAREVADQLGKKVDEAFAPESGHVTRALERHFSDESSAAVQNRIRQVIEEVMTKSRQDLVRQFSSADGQNPLADFKSATVAALNQAGQKQNVALIAMHEQVAALQQEVQGLRAEREKEAELDAERERGTAKGRTFEEQVAAELDRIAGIQGDDCDSVGDLRGASGRTGDIVVALEGCRGPARGRVVFEVKTGKLARPAALRELDRALQERDADFAVLVVPNEDKVPAKMRQLREYNGDKMIVTFEPDGDTGVGLEVAYSLARARVLMSRAESGGVDAAAVRDTVERALTATEDVRRIKSQLSGAETSIGNARELLDEMADRVREHLRQIDGLVMSADAAEEPQARLI